MRSGAHIALVLSGAAVMACSSLAYGQAANAGRAAGNDKGELWEVTTKMEMAGMPMAMPAQTNKMCIGKNAGDEAFVPQQEDCKLTQSSRSGNTHRYRMVCTGKNAMTADGEVTRTADQYSGRMRMKARMEGQDMDMTQTFSGKKLGECAGTLQNQVAKIQSDHAANMEQMCRKGVEGLATHLFVGPGAMCEDRKAQFCGEVKKVAASARDPAGYDALRKRNSSPQGAFAACNEDYAAIGQAACSRAAETRNLAFIASGACDEDVRRLGDTGCRGRSFTSIEPAMRGLCSRYATVTRGQGQPVAAQAPAAPATAAVVPKAADPVQQGLDSVRKWLPF